MEAIVAQRQIGRYTDLFDFCERADPRKVNRRAVEALIGGGALDHLVTVGPTPEESVSTDYARAILLANQVDAVKLAEQKLRNHDSGVQDLFGEEMLMPTGERGRYKHFETLQCLSLKDRLSKEKETLGLYLTGHPIDVYGNELKYLAKCRIVDLRTGSDDQTVAGLIVAMRTMRSRKGETIAFITLDDRSGRVEVSVFAELYEHNRNLLVKDNVVVVKGSASNDDFTDGIKIRAAEVFSMDQARARSAKKLKVNVDHRSLPPDFASELAKILTPFTGSGEESCPVAVEYCRSEARAEVVLGDEWRVRLSDDLIQNLRDRYGSEQVHLHY